LSILLDNNERHSYIVDYIKGIACQADAISKRRKQKMAGKPNDKEEEYFIKKEFEKKRKLEEQKHKKLGEEEKKKLKELHFMRCPKCGMELIEIYYSGVHTDKCSECGGIWLDTGEFETLLKSDKSILNGLFSMFTK
jgi:uncharacterized protein with PIN domain